MKKYLITGVSSGIGKVVTEKLILNGDVVWGVARRKKLLNLLKNELKTSKFKFSSFDVSDQINWLKFTKKLKSEKFFPDTVIFNAGVYENDLLDGIDIDKLEYQLRVNFLGVMYGVKALLPVMGKNSQIIAVSSLSAFKGNAREGIGYASSKAALSISFESLYQKYINKKIIFKTIHLGPVNSGMIPFKNKSLFMLSEQSTADSIIKAINSAGVNFDYPWYLFFVMKCLKLLPSELYFFILSKIEKFNRR